MMRRKVGKLLGDRRVVGGFLLLIQLAIVMFGVSWASTEYHWLTPALTVLSVIIVIWLVRKYDNPMYKITWILVIVLLPLFGGLFYLFWGNTPLNRARTQHQYEPKPPDFTDYMRTPATKELIEQHPRHAARARYIETLDGMPVWTNTETKYFRVGEEMFDSMCKELRRAQKFIFLEYFIIEEGVMWDTILDILREKAAAGLDVRVLYDDVGSICTLPKNYDRYLMSLGIHAVRFNRFIPTLNTYLNYRNHRKMTIIDGNVGYMVNGAGLAMATMDMIKLYGGQPANFLDIGGSSNPVKVIEAMKLLLQDEKVKVVLINIFGGITRCDDVAMGLLQAFEQINSNVPVIVRLTGTNEHIGRELLRNYSRFQIATTMKEAALMALKA